MQEIDKNCGETSCYKTRSFVPYEMVKNDHSNNFKVDKIHFQNT